MRDYVPIMHLPLLSVSFPTETVGPSPIFVKAETVTLYIVPGLRLDITKLVHTTLQLPESSSVEFQHKTYFTILPFGFGEYQLRYIVVRLADTDSIFGGPGTTQKIIDYIKRNHQLFTRIGVKASSHV